MGLRLCLSNTLGREVRAEEPLCSLGLEESLLAPPVETRLRLCRAAGCGWLLSGAGSRPAAARGWEGKRGARARSLLDFPSALPGLGTAGSGRQRHTGSSAAGRAALYSLKGAQNLQASSPAASKGGDPGRDPALCRGCVLLRAQQGPAACVRLHREGDGRSCWYPPALCPSVFMAFIGEQNCQWRPRSEPA